MGGREKGRNDRNNRKEYRIGRQQVWRVLADDRQNNGRDAAQRQSKAESQREPGKARLSRKHLGDDIQRGAKTFREAAGPARHAGVEDYFSATAAVLKSCSARLAAFKIFLRAWAGLPW
jgi:hypothetical protein